MPLEVFDVVVGGVVDGDGRPLHTLAQAADGIVEVIARLRAGTACRAAGPLLPAVEFDAVVVVGGGAAPVAARLRDAGEAVSCVDDRFFAVRAGRRLSPHDNVVVVDIGQTSIKVCDRDGSCVVIERTVVVDGADARTSDLAQLASVLRGVRDGAGGLVLGICAEVDDDVSLGPCTWGWRDGDRSFVNDLVVAGGFGDVDVVVVNDAELAAVGLDVAVDTLLLTVGFGVGAALQRAL